MKSSTIYIGLSILLIGYFVYTRLQPDPYKTHSETGVQFMETSFDEAKQLATTEDKLLFVEVYAPWCGSCKKMKKTSLSDTEVGERFDETFVSVAINGDASPGDELAEQWGVQGYPTLFVMDQSGTILAKQSGYHDKEALLAIASKWH